MDQRYCVPRLGGPGAPRGPVAAGDREGAQGPLASPPALHRLAGLQRQTPGKRALSRRVQHAGLGTTQPPPTAQKRRGRFTV